MHGQRNLKFLIKICSPIHISLEGGTQVKGDIMYFIHKEISTGIALDNWGDPDVDRRIILRGIFRKWEGIMGTGWSGLRKGTGGGHL
jgi:hypothetical protein